MDAQSKIANAENHGSEAQQAGFHLPAHGHDPASQPNLCSNPDPALHYSHEHPHQHMHHNLGAVEGPDDDAVYSHGLTPDKPSLTAPNTQDGRRQPHRNEEKAASKSEVLRADAEKGIVSPSSLSPEEDGPRSHKVSRSKIKWNIIFHAAFLALMTGYVKFLVPSLCPLRLTRHHGSWWIAGLILHRKDRGWIVPFLLWLFIAVRIATLYVPVSLVMRPTKSVWKHTIVRLHDLIPAKLRKPLAAAGTVGVMLIGAFVSEESADNTRANRAVSLFGLVVMIAVLWATSRDRSKVRTRASVLAKPVSEADRG